jgi:hypothetical protein
MLGIKSRLEVFSAFRQAQNAWQLLQQCADLWRRNMLAGHRMLFKPYRITVESEPKETV